MAEIEVKVAMDVDGDPQMMANLLAEYLTSADADFYDAYSYEAWGGWDGPFVRSVTITMPDGRQVASESWPTKKEKE